MSKTASNSAATKALRKHIRDKATGCLVTSAGAAEVRVYLLKGSLISAESNSDVHRCVHLLARRGSLSDTDAHAMRDRVDDGESCAVLGELLELDDEMDLILAGRFRQNLSEFLGSAQRPIFDPSASLFVLNLQIGHDAQEIVQRCCALFDEAASLNIDQTVMAGKSPFSGDIQLMVAKVLGEEEMTLSSILLSLPFEELEGRKLLLDMLTWGQLSVPGAVEDAVEDAETETRIPKSELERRAKAGFDDELGGGTQSPSDLDQWLEQASAVDDDELDFFADHDHERGSAEEGAFSTATHNLETVEVFEVENESPPAPAPAPAQEDGNTPRFNAPELSEDEARRKLDVANDALRAVVAAFDTADGTGRGQMVVQLLVDGSPPKYQHLLQQLSVHADGALPFDGVLQNLYSRPATEHRHLMNQTLIDIIDRALSSAADELPDEAFDHVLESVAGYRQRLGL